MISEANKRWLRRQFLKSIKGITLFRHWKHILNFSVINIVDKFPAYAANSSGSYRDIASLARLSVNETPALLARLSESSTPKLKQADIDDSLSNGSTDQIVKNFKSYGSDKASFHNYHLVYASLFPDPQKVKKVFEIGLGTNNPEVVSSMGFHGKPGASLRAFRDFFPNAHVYGADVDKRVLFEEERINTFFIDQLDDQSFKDLPSDVFCDLDMYIDDGLHSPDANLRSLIFGLEAVRPGGFVIIEDIREEAIDIWNVAHALLPDNCEATLYRGIGAYMFVVKKL